MATTVVGLFDSTSQAQKAANALEQSGYSRGDIEMTQQSQGVAQVRQGTTGPTESGWDRFLESLHLREPEDAEYYSQGVQARQVILSVMTEDDRADAAADTLRRNGALSIDEHAAQYRATAPNAGRQQQAANVPANGAAGRTVIPVVEERLQVGKRAVDRGGVRIYRHVTEKPVEEQVTLHEEHVNVERRPVDAVVDVSEADHAFEEGTIEMRETSEEAVVSKNARVVEQVLVGKTASDRTETVRDTVRRSDVEVEKFGADGKVRSSDESRR